MKTAIIYATSHGTTGKVARQIGEKIGLDSTTIINLKETKNVDLSEVENVIIGGSIHAGMVQGVVKEFCKKNMLDLLQKRVALFICAMNKPEYETELKNAFPELVYQHAIHKSVVGGEFNFDKMNFIEKMIVRKVSGVNESVSKLDGPAIDEIANLF